MSLHRYIAHTDSPDFTTAMSVGGGGNEYISSDNSEPGLIGTNLAGGSYQAAMTFLSFDTTGILSTPTTVTLTLGQLFSAPFSSADLIVAVYDWGASIDTGDWRASAQLAGLTEVGRFATVDLPGDGLTFDVDLDPSAVVLGGTTRFVLFTENMATPTTDPVGDEDFFVDCDGGANPPILLIDGDPPPDPPHPLAGGTRLRTVDIEGTVVDEFVTNGMLTLASLESVIQTLNQPDEFPFFFPKHAYEEDAVPVWGNDTRVVEVQVWDARPGEPIDPDVDFLLTWGPTVDMQTAGSDGAMHAVGKGVDTYLFAPPRYIDGQRPNLVSNGSFETGDTTDWDDGGAITATVTTDWAVEGTHSLRVVSSTPGGDIHEHQTFVVDGEELGRLLTITAFYKLETFTAPAYANRGLFVEAIEAGVVVAQNVVEIKGTPTTGIEQRAEMTLQVPPNKTWTIDVRLYAPQGSTLWDEVQCVVMDSVSTAGELESIEHLVRLFVLHVQDSAVGKSDVNITTDPDAFDGPRIAKTWQWVDEVPCDSAMLELIERDDGIDYAMRLNPVTGERLLETFWPRRGTDYTTDDVHLVSGGNLSDYRWQKDGMACVTTATAIGDGDGPDREDGYYSDPSHIGGLTIEKVFRAPPNTAINSLKPLAKGAVVGSNNPPKLIEVDVPADTLCEPGGALDGKTMLRGLVTGDRVPLTIDQGYVQEAASMWRIVRLTFTNSTRMLTMTLNREPA